MIYVLLCALNEERAVPPTINAIISALEEGREEFRIVLVDDGSTDRTVEVAEAAAAQAARPVLTVLRHAENRGLGAGLRTGIYWILDRAGEQDTLVTMDADNTHPAATIPSMIAQLRRGKDVVIASRYRRGARVRGVPGYRRLLSDTGRLVFQVGFPISGVRDFTCCFRAYRMEPLRTARAIYGDELCTARGFEAVLDLLLRLRQIGITAGEVPLDLNYTERAGQSKMKVMRTIRNTLLLLGRRFVERFTTYSPRRIRARLSEVGATE